MPNKSKIYKKDDNFYSEEYELKFSKDKIAELKAKLELENKQRDFALSQISKDDKESEAKIRESYNEASIEFPIPVSIKGKNGEVVSKHKNKLGLIFIGDAEKAENLEKSKINAPKISMIIGGGLESSYNPIDNKVAEIDLRKDFFPMASAQFHLISLTDIDTRGILSAPSIDNIAAIKMESDVLELSSRKYVFIRSLGRPYLADGTKQNTPGGVFIVSGQSDMTTPEPMVLGQKLSTTLQELVTQINKINSVVCDIVDDILTLKTSLMAHFHPIAPIPGPPFLVAAQSLDLIGNLSTTIATKTSINMFNSTANKINLETFKINNLTPYSSKKFISEFNRVN